MAGRPSRPVLVSVGGSRGPGSRGGGRQAGPGGSSARSTPKCAASMRTPCGHREGTSRRPACRHVCMCVQDHCAPGATVRACARGLCAKACRGVCAALTPRCGAPAVLARPPPRAVARRTARHSTYVLEHSRLQLPPTHPPRRTWPKLPAPRTLPSVRPSSRWNGDDSHTLAGCSGEAKVEAAAAAGDSDEDDVADDVEWRLPMVLLPLRRNAAGGG